MATSVWAAWFGPDNYEECVYEKVKACDGNGQCSGAAKRLCDKDFPYVLGKWEYITWDDYLDSNGKYQIASSNFLTKMCFQNKKKGLDEECVEWKYGYELTLVRTTSFEIAESISKFHKFLNPSKTKWVDGTTYTTFRAQRKRKGD